MRVMSACALLCGLAALAAALPAVAAPPPLIIGHRGAAGERPEHTAMGYRLAIAEGADFIEPDLVMTKDGVLIARHENEIGATTDVAAHPEFAARRTTKTIDGHTVTGWFSEDFTLAEIRTLRARERLPELRPGNAAYDGHGGILTFQEVIDLAGTEGVKAGRTVGVYAELKHPTYFARVGLPMEPRFIATIRANGLASRSSPFIFECFEMGALKTVRRAVDVRTVFLMDSAGAPADLVAAGDKRTYADLTTPAALKAIAAFADGIGPAKSLIVPRDREDRSLTPTRLIQDAHAAGLVVHPFTFRSENAFLPAELRRGDAGAADAKRQIGDAEAEYRTFFTLGVDGLFTDFPDVGVRAREAFLRAGTGQAATNH
jgi:glycerophosphoryl diester phosphodiesterase